MDTHFLLHWASIFHSLHYIRNIHIVGCSFSSPFHSLNYLETIYKNKYGMILTFTFHNVWIGHVVVSNVLTPLYTYTEPFCGVCIWIGYSLLLKVEQVHPIVTRLALNQITARVSNVIEQLCSY
jgi:hypothetical protein